jgi:hypothetical protein
MSERITVRVWRNWYTRTLEVRVALPYEFESRHPHCLCSCKLAIVNQKSATLHPNRIGVALF